MVTTFVAWRRGARAGWSLLVSGAGLLTVGLAPDLAPVALAVSLAGFAGFRLHRWGSKGRRRQTVPDIDVAFACLAAWAALRQAFPGLESALEIPRVALLVLAGASLELGAIGSLAAASLAVRATFGAPATMGQEVDSITPETKVGRFVMQGKKR